MDHEQTQINPTNKKKPPTGHAAQAYGATCNHNLSALPPPTVVRFDADLQKQILIGMRVFLLRVKAWIKTGASLVQRFSK